MELFIAAGSPVPACASSLIFLHLCSSTSHPTSPLLSAIVAAPALLRVNYGCCKSPCLEQPLVTAIYIKRSWHHTKANEIQTPGQRKKLLSQLNQAKQRCSQDEKSSGRAGLAMAKPSFRAVWLHVCLPVFQIHLSCGLPS